MAIAEWPARLSLLGVCRLDIFPGEMPSKDNPERVDERGERDLLRIWNKVSTVRGKKWGSVEEAVIGRAPKLD